MAVALVYAMCSVIGVSVYTFRPSISALPNIDGRVRVARVQATWVQSREGSSMASDRVKFNVGGTLFETTFSTIEKLGSAYFARLLDPDSGFCQPVDGVFFIDRDPECFRVILNIARYGEVFLSDKHVSIDMVETEAEFYLLSESCRAAIAKFKSEPCRGKVAVLTAGGTGSGLCLCLDMSVEDFTSSRGDFLYHHACLKKERQYLFAGGMGYDLVCSINTGCPETLVRPRDQLVCCRCSREIDVTTPRTEIVDWCHRCRRCLRCTETFCVLLKR